jgi:glycosyltransferase involved in cell wall biosynthesis
VVVVVPALNEAMIIGKVVADLLSVRAIDDGEQHLIERVLVCDNGSTDGTDERAREAGATVLPAPQRGYGAACLVGLAYVQAMQPQPDIVLFADGDGSVVAEEARILIASIQQGNDMVIGVRSRAKQEAHALTLPQQVGNLVASILIFCLWQKWVSDLGPFRAIRTCALWRLDMRDESFGWTVEMQVKALQAGCKVSEVSVTTLRRVGKSKISGTVSGVIGAARGIIGKIVGLKLAERRARQQPIVEVEQQNIRL